MVGSNFVCVQVSCLSLRVHDEFHRGLVKVVEEECWVLFVSCVFMEIRLVREMWSRVVGVGEEAEKQHGESSMHDSRDP